VGAKGKHVWGEKKHLHMAAVRDSASVLLLALLSELAMAWPHLTMAQAADARKAKMRQKRGGDYVMVAKQR
jgi:hypothetical protein